RDHRGDAPFHRAPGPSSHPTGPGQESRPVRPAGQPQPEIQPRIHPWVALRLLTTSSPIGAPVVPSKDRVKLRPCQVVWALIAQVDPPGASDPEPFVPG